jgi:drug/metabolite transporter (DMT)-like permease
MMACLVRFLSDTNVWMTTLFRFLVGIGIISLFAMSGKIRLEFVNNKGLYVRGFIGGISTAIFFYSITKLGLIKAGFIASLYPVFAVIFGYFLLKEQLSRVKMISLTGAFIGVMFLMRNPSQAGTILNSLGLNELLAIGGTMLSGLTVVSIKKLQTTDSTVAIFFAQCLIGACIVFVPASTHTAMISSSSLLLLIAMGILATSGQLLLTNGYKYVDVSTGSIIVMTTPVLNTIAGYVFFREALSLQMAVGAVIILVSLAGLVFGREKGNR